jgi:Trypsin-like serine proteases, typically periplasmic, contain C-terminal PDZ domain
MAHWLKDAMVALNRYAVVPLFMPFCIFFRQFDGNEFTGEITGTDKDTDIAIIKIFGSGYTPVRLGVSGDLKIGQLVIAIGNPLGYQHSVSVGVLSGVGRTMRTPGGQLIDDILQSDAAMNPGNSGFASCGLGRVPLLPFFCGYEPGKITLISFLPQSPS